MDILNTNKFDIKKAQRIMDIYKDIVGVNCILIDKYGTELYTTSIDKDHCKFCSIVKKDIDKFPGCKNIHLYGAYQSERFGGEYVFFCPLGLVHWASPIIKNGDMEAAILGGPVLMVDHDEFFEEDIKGKLDINKINISLLRSELNEIVYLNSKKVKSMSEALHFFANNLSDDSVLEYERAWSRQIQQDSISNHIHLNKKSKNNDKSYPINKEKALQKAIKLGDKEESSKLINEILGYIYFYSGNDFEVIKTRSIELIILLSRSALEGGADSEQIFGMNYVYIKEIEKLNTIEELTDWLKKIMTRFTDLVFNLKDIKHVDTMFKALSFIKSNYMNKISLEDTSEEVHLSPSYFSKIFKQEMKCNFNTYLNFYRIEISKDLLKDPDVELVDIAYIVGYEDQSYFSKVFKKITGTSPGKYRESLSTK